jgi:hypothetical protein
LTSDGPIFAASDRAGDSEASEIDQFFQTFRFQELGEMEQSRSGTLVPGLRTIFLAAIKLMAGFDLLHPEISASRMDELGHTWLLFHGRNLGRWAARP